MDISEVKRTVDLLKKANNKSYVTLPEVAREFKKRKTDIMAFVEDHPKLFELSERWKPKKKVVTKTMFGNKYKEEIQVRGASLGLCIEQAYLKASDNFRTNEWLERMKKEKAKYLHISVFNNYGYIQGYYLELDSKDSEYRYHLWRNTQEKIDQIKDYLNKTSSVFGGFGDSYTVTKEYGITAKAMGELKKQGWTFNELPEISK